MAQICHDVLGAVVEGIIPVESIKVDTAMNCGKGSSTTPGRSSKTPGLNGSMMNDSSMSPSSSSSSSSSSPEFQLLRDAFNILCCDEIKIGRVTGGAAGGGANSVNEEMEAAAAPTAGAAGAAAGGGGGGGKAARGAAFAAAKGRLLTKMSKKLVIKDTLPVLIRLKQMLEAAHSPLLKDLMRCVGREDSPCCLEGVERERE